MLTIMRLASSNTPPLTIPLSEIDDRYCRYRLVTPRADRSMMESLKRYGQISPVVMGESGNGHYVLIDGFKRLRAARRLDLPELQASVIKAEDRALKTAMFHLNRKSGSLSTIEEAMIVQALHRENNLTQIEIGTLLGFSKTWVCRRLSLIERVHEEVLEQIRLGLIGPGIVREVSKLPRGNQTEALHAIRKHRLTCRETAQLIGLLKEKPSWAHDTILYFPEPILSQRQEERPPGIAEYGKIATELTRIRNRCESLVTRLKDLWFDPVLPWQHCIEIMDDIDRFLTEARRSIQVQETSDADF
jgi:ParB/RepB/Spo0J family partition protein